MARFQLGYLPLSDPALIQCVPELDFSCTRSCSKSASTSTSGASSTLPTPVDEYEPLLRNWDVVNAPAKSYATMQPTRGANQIKSVQPQERQEAHHSVQRQHAKYNQQLSLPPSLYPRALPTLSQPQHVTILRQGTRTDEESQGSVIFNAEVFPKTTTARRAFASTIIAAQPGIAFASREFPTSSSVFQRKDPQYSLSAIERGSTRPRSTSTTTDASRYKTHKRQKPSLKLALEARGIQLPVLQFQHKRLLVLRSEVADVAADVARSEVAPNLLPPGARIFIAYISSKHEHRQTACSSPHVLAPPNSASCNNDRKYALARQRAADIKRQKASAEQSSLAVMTLVLGVLVLWVAAMGMCCVLGFI